ncbi:uncharacterized protein LTHEOB_8405 [Lasiodiplodia theobromae]|uniref:uncharacterized protein n=1 Tax=Lasiodiplodia theobromae TaxID=45133 RepID=UPI0015C328ED|nr:uncharacterized protein LTHEOB_8405 [Lasiodiplodia theobromae]KAF4541824.1 hypothetical protein LTHEOB_8405 [Lasiodiplodia theobromae]
MSFDPNGKMLKVVKNFPRAVSQDEIDLSDFCICLDCRAGHCNEHATYTRFKRHLNLRNTSAALVRKAMKAEKKHQGLAILSNLPPELACDIALHLPIQELHRLSTCPPFQPFWAAHEAYLIRHLLAEYAAEAKLYPLAAIFGTAAANNMTAHQRILYFESMRACTDAVVAHFTTTLSLPPDMSTRLRVAVQHLWRVFGLGGNDSALPTGDERRRRGMIPPPPGMTTRRQAAVTRFCALPQALRQDICALLFEELGAYFECVHPVWKRMAKPADDKINATVSPWAWAGVSDNVVAQMRRCGVWRASLAYYALENVRVAMRGMYAKAAAASANSVELDAKAVEVVLRQARRDDAGFSMDHETANFSFDHIDTYIGDIIFESKSMKQKWIFPDPWTYSISLGFSQRREFLLYPPRGHTHRDLYVEMSMAKYMPDGMALDIARSTQNVIHGGYGHARRNTWQFRRDQEDNDWLANPTDHMMAWLMNCAFPLRPQDYE